MLTQAAEGAPNGVRLAKSIAALAVGLEVWAGCLGSVGLELSATITELVDSLLTLPPPNLLKWPMPQLGERFLELVRQLIACGAARLGEREDEGISVGEWSDYRSIAYFLPAPTFGRLRRYFADAAARLGLPGDGHADLVRRGAIAEHDKDRRTKKARVGGASLNTWAILGGRLEW